MSLFKSIIRLTPVGQLMQAHKADKRGKREAENQRNAQAQQENTVRQEQGRINERLAAAQAKTNAGVARQNRSRMKGGLFGEDNTAGGTPVTARLG